MGAPIHGMDTIMEPWVLQPMLGSWHPWVRPLPLEGHHHGATIGAPTNVQPLAPMGAPIQGMDISMEPLVLQPILSSWHPWVHPLPWDGPNNGPIELYTPFSIM